MLERSESEQLIFRDYHDLADCAFESLLNSKTGKDIPGNWRPLIRLLYEREVEKIFDSNSWPINLSNSDARREIFHLLDKNVAQEVYIEAHYPHYNDRNYKPPVPEDMIERDTDPDLYIPRNRFSALVHKILSGKRKAPPKTAPSKQPDLSPFHFQAATSKEDSVIPGPDSTIQRFIAAEASGNKTIADVYKLLMQQESDDAVRQNRERRLSHDDLAA